MKYFMKVIQECVNKVVAINGDPLDGDETEAIAKMFNLVLDHDSGNITDKEYEKGISKLKME